MSAAADVRVKTELEALFNWNPPPLRPASKDEEGSQSQNSRPPSFYDMHLSERLVLKHIVHVPHLHKKIASVVDQKLKALEDKGIMLPPLKSSFVTAESRLDLEEEAELDMKNKRDIQDQYLTTTATYCIPVASTLGLHPQIWGKVIRWSSVPRNSGYAICDGSLQIIKPDPSRRVGRTGEPRPFLWDFIEPDKRKALLDVTERYKDLATWEFKSLSVGTKDVMLGIITTAVRDGEFKWTFCSGDPCMSKRFGHDDWNPKRGLDAPETLSLVTTPWNHPDSSEDAQSQNPRLGGTQEETWDASLMRGGSSLKIVWELHQPPLHTRPFTGMSLEGGSPAKSIKVRTGVKKKSPLSKDSNEDSYEDPNPMTKGDSNATTSTSYLWDVVRNPPSVDSTIVDATSIGTDLLTAPSYDSHQTETNGQKKLTPTNLIQQAWAQGVRSNSTLIILNSGNFEFVAVHHRDSQTLYISDILHIPRLSSPGYGKLQIGIYLEALEDAFLRNELDKTNPPPRGEPGINTSPPSPGSGKDGHSQTKRKELEEPSKPKGKKSKGDGGDKRSGGGKSVQRAHRNKGRQSNDGLNWTIQQAQSRYVLLLHIQYDIFDSVRPAIFNRGLRINSDDILSPPTSPVTSFGKEERLLLVLTSKLGEGATGIAHGGILMVESGNKYSTLEIAAKLAFTDDQQESLRAESLVYPHMAEKRLKCIPTVLGYFHDVDKEGPSCLLMTYSGKPLQDRGAFISAAECTALLSALDSIHAAGVLHGDVRLENLLIKDSGDVYIIDFDQARMNASEADLREEYAALYEMLHEMVDPDEKDAVSSVEPELVALATEGQREGKGKDGEKDNREGTFRGHTASRYDLRPRNRDGKVVADKRT